MKHVNGGSDWFVHHNGISVATKCIFLNDNSGETTQSDFGNALPGATHTATSTTGQSLYVDDSGATTTLAPDSSWTATTNGTFAKVYLRPGELTFDTKGGLVSPTQRVEYKGDFPADIETG